MSELLDEGLERSLLGKQVGYSGKYDPSLLFAIPRAWQRADINLANDLPFKGIDIWNAFELSWLNSKGKPEVAIGEFIFPCESPQLVESKSLKLYLNSFNQTVFESTATVKTRIQQDLSDIVGSTVKVDLIALAKADKTNEKEFEGKCLDASDISCDTYEVTPELLQLEIHENSKSVVTETVYSHLLKSNCLVTGQPDWASIQISYTGKKICHDSLLRYIVSFRNHAGFHEQCIERIFVDIMCCCKPEKLTVYGRYTRRGGIDINPIRSTDDYRYGNIKLSRQ